MSLSILELAKLQTSMEALAHDFGLDFFPVHYEVVDWETMSQLAALGGFPTRYPHWRFGMEYYKMHRSYGYGLHKIYEMVLNTNPSIAYLLASNEMVDHKTVILHVCGHVHCFKHNVWFANTNRDMLNEMASHATRIRRYIDKYGLEPVEQWIDYCLSLDNLIDIHSLGIQRHRHPEEMGDDKTSGPARYPSSEYMDPFINPRPSMEEAKQKKDEQKQAQKRFPVEPEADVLLFILENAPLEAWQADILGIIREEMYYFVPQAQTKILNEGFAVFCHSRLMTEKAADSAEIIDFARHHSGVVSARRGQLNPYRLGWKLLQDIEDRWDRGAFGTDYDLCQDFHQRETWDTGLGKGMEKVFEVVKYKHDISLLQEFLTFEFAVKNKLFTYDYRESDDTYVIASRRFEEVKQRLLMQLTNWGQPIIVVNDGNYRNQGELYLYHKSEMRMLDLDWARDALIALENLWCRPVILETIIENKDWIRQYHLYCKNGAVTTSQGDILVYKDPPPSSLPPFYT